MNTTDTWSAVQQRAAVPGSAILTAWKAEREAARGGVRNDVVSSSSPSMFELFNAVPAASGVYVNAVSAMRVSAVFACVQRIAGAIASVPMNIYERTKTGRQMVEDSPLWWLLNEQPTARYTAASHWESVSAHQLLRGDAFTFIRRDGMGNIKELIPLPWDCVVPQRVTNEADSRLKYYVHDISTFGVEQDDMLHFPGFGFNGVTSMSVIQWAARNAAGNALAMDEYSGRFFAGGAHPSTVLKTDKQMNETQVSALQSAFANKYSGIENAHKLPLVLTEGLDIKEISLNPEDAQLLEARKFQVIDIARAFGVPPHLIGETSASTAWGSGIESMSRGFVQYTLQQHLVRIEQEANRKLFRTAKRFVQFDRSALLQGDSKAQAEFFRAALGGPGSGPGWMSVDEVRHTQHMAPKGGDCDKVYDPRTAPTPAAGSGNNNQPSQGA